MEEPLIPSQQLSQEITDLETQRDNLYLKFKEIETALAQKRKLIEAFELVKSSPKLQEDLKTEMKHLGMIP